MRDVSLTVQFDCLARVWRAPYVAKVVGWLLDDYPGLDEYEIAKRLGFGLRETRDLIDDLVRRGLVRRVPSSEGDG
jgi:hypothetical protein